MWCLFGQTDIQDNKYFAKYAILKAPKDMFIAYCNVFKTFNFLLQNKLVKVVKV